MEYSTNGKTWKSLVEIKGDNDQELKIVEPLVADVLVEGLATSTLYIRHYTRGMDRESKTGAGRWMKLRISGDPSWGDAEQTFFKSQPRLWISTK